jgi:hypothetical protein
MPLLHHEGTKGTKRDPNIEQEDFGQQRTTQVSFVFFVPSW